MALSADLEAMGEHEFVSLTTFRRSGVPVATAVWIARHDDALVVTTGAGSGKVKRLRNDPTIELRPCTRSGEVAAGAPVVRARAEVVSDETVAATLREPIARKYGLQYKAIDAAGRVASVLRSRPVDRVILRITDLPTI